MFSWSRRHFILSVAVVSLLLVLTQGVRLVVFGQPAGPVAPDPDQAPLNVAVDEALFSSGNEDFAGVEGPAWQLDQTAGQLTQPFRDVITDPKVPITPGGKIADIVKEDEKRRVEARRELIVTEEKLAQRFINTIIEQETAYYVDLLEQVITNLNTTRASWEQVKAGVRYVNSQTATNKG